jgi:hypothetical protein
MCQLGSEMTLPEDQNPVAAAIDLLGGDSVVARLAGLKTSWSVSKWRKGLPADRVLWLSEQTGWQYTPHMLAGILYPNPTDGLPQMAEADEKAGA